ncbi:hypothetical protein H1O16_gp271 [Burkholderia phage BcepSaruman]|uniref:Tail fiber protein n=1 Tax=Burkholderia phage BcepSaruman TaxID=2530032 RepID=A0A4D5ZCJ8_9CAUD|nr:hypothetical protein H1O16_gp271 [Burkholderia phage BcepSaruman]QBX06684.1 hypothetical protein BcepSaruman_271 [Burkholderia phage BcepSaruman]
MGDSFVIKTGTRGSGVPVINENLVAKYYANQTINQTIVLKPGQQWDADVGFSALTISTDKPVFVSTVVGTGTPTAVAVDQQLSIDDPVDQFFITNRSDTDTAVVQITFVVHSTTDPMPIKGIVTSVNNKTGEVVIEGGPGIGIDNTGSTIRVNNTGVLRINDMYPMGDGSLTIEAVDAHPGTGNSLISDSGAHDARMKFRTLVAGANITIDRDPNDNLIVSGDLNRRTIKIVYATADGQGTFVIPGGFTPNVVDVYLMGAYLERLAYDGTGGVQIVLAPEVAAMVVAGAPLVTVEINALRIADVVAESDLGSAGGAALVGTTYGKNLQAVLDDIRSNLGQGITAGRGIDYTNSTITNLGVLSINGTAPDNTGNYVLTIRASDVQNLATVAKTGNYSDLLGLPTIPAPYTLPQASSTVLGGIKLGTGMSMAADGTVNITASGTVKTVNGASPDGNGNVNLVPYDNTAPSGTSVMSAANDGSGKTRFRKIVAYDSNIIVGADGNDNVSIQMNVPTFGPSGVNAKNGLVPSPGSTAGTTRYLREDGTWTAPPTATIPPQPYDIMTFYPGTPVAGATFYRTIFARSVAFAAGLSGITGNLSSSMVATTGIVIIGIYKNGVMVGDITYPAGSSTGTVNISNPVTFAAGDVMTFAAGVTDTTFSGVSITLNGTR